MIKRRKNARPEELVNGQLRAWFIDQGWTMQRVESKAVWSPGAGRYLAGMTTKYTTDWLGVLPTGRASFIETKALGKWKSISYGQYHYLAERIRTRAFGACVDSVERLVLIYGGWAELPPSLGIQYLLDQLPPEPAKPKPKLKRAPGR